MSQIHLVEKHRGYRLLDPSRGLYISGDWVFGRKVPPTLVGAEIHLHKRQVDPSYLAGTVVGLQPAPSTSRYRRFALIFLVNRAAAGATTPRKGWRRERKLVP